MKEWHDAEHRVGGARMHHLVDRLDVSGNIVVREHHSLGHAGRAGRENHRRHIVAPHAVQAQQAIQHKRRCRVGPQRRGQLVSARHLRGKIFEVDQLRLQIERCSFSITFRLVSTWRMPARRMQALSTSSEAV